MIRLFRVFLPTSVLGLLVSETLLILGCYVGALFLLGDLAPDIYLFYAGGAERIGIVTGSLLAGLYLSDLYGRLRITSKILLLQQFCLVVGAAFMLQALLAYALPEWVLGRWHMILGSFLVLAILPMWRMLYSKIVFEILYRQKLLFVGASALTRKIVETIGERKEFGMDSVGYLAEAEVSGLGPHLGRADDVKAVYEQVRPTAVVVGLEERRGQMPVKALLELRLGGARIEDAATVFETVTGRVPVQSVRPSHLLFSRELGPAAKQLQFQRAYSFLLALIATVLTLPIMVLVALLIRLTSRGPALFRQERVGFHGRVFQVYKFRSMRQDAEMNTGAVWAQKDDPRITPVGRWLRKLRLDELPQFFNVLKGDMAIVGPRPERPEFVQSLTEEIPFYGQRHAVPPGITGWAQINHKYGDTKEDTVRKLEYDLYYLKNMSLSLDLYIMFHTVKVMLLQRGAQ
jgi:sugar transferase (PEP-CTERM system associated)